MKESQFFLSHNLLNQLQQPVLFAQNQRFVHGNQAASEILALGGEDLSAYFNPDQLSALEELTPGQSTSLTMVCGETRYRQP